MEESTKWKLLIGSPIIWLIAFIFGVNWIACLSMGGFQNMLGFMLLLKSKEGVKDE